MRSGQRHTISVAAGGGGVDAHEVNAIRIQRRVKD
jgi:hypothetical protein